MKIIFSILAVFLVAASASAADVLEDFDGLGENKDLFDKAKALHPDMKVVVVQDRIVQRRNRFEIGPEIAMIGGGDKYIDTTSWGGSVQFHINPWVSVGGRYSYFTNDLNSEADNLINEQGIIPDIDHPENSTIGFVNFYPIYGKMNSMNLGITHFDLYLTAGYGSIALKNGTVPTWIGGLGVGFWFSKYVTSRIEVRYQEYEATRNQTQERLGTVVSGLTVGILL